VKAGFGGGAVAADGPVIDPAMPENSLRTGNIASKSSDFGLMQPLPGTESQPALLPKQQNR
jgi:hypothetical protein